MNTRQDGPANVICFPATKAAVGNSRTARRLKSRHVEPPVKKKKASAGGGSDIVRHCVIYAQSIAAFNAGFYSDRTPEHDYAGCSPGTPGRRHFDAANRALQKLNAAALSEHHARGTRDARTSAELSEIELFAKIRVLILLTKQVVGGALNEEESLYIRLLGLEVERYVCGKIEAGP